MGGLILMKRTLAIALIFVMLLSAFGSFALADETTIAGTPRSETLIVEGLDGVISNASQHNP